MSNIVLSQAGKIQYEVKLGIDLKEVDKTYVEFFKEIVDYGNNQQFQLLFNNKSSSFKYVEKLNNDTNFDKNADLIARTFINSSSDVYVDYIIKKVVLKEPDGTLIEKKYDPAGWEITNESKIIGTYLSYKAKKIVYYTSAKGQSKNMDVIAWFAPNLPYPYGPIDFYGLPGLILELTQNKATFLATKIDLVEEEIKIDFPKGKTITKEEYDKKLESSMGGVLIGKKREMEKDKQ
ncbi:GLPGLI family protein [Flavobacterium sp. CG_9.1]|nr:GLPGLI family protein [Flavobacterium sp. CG_9.1]